VSDRSDAGRDLFNLSSILFEGHNVLNASAPPRRGYLYFLQFPIDALCVFFWASLSTSSFLFLFLHTLAKYCMCHMEQVSYDFM
jgi:hypothetical protein